MIEQSISHYRIIKKLGSGGMGEVYLAEDLQLGRNVALKLLPEDFALDETRMRRFMQEARAASGLNHPNILTVYEFGEANSTYFMATEFIDGVTLRNRIGFAPMKTLDSGEPAAQRRPRISALPGSAPAVLGIGKSPLYSANAIEVRDEILRSVFLSSVIRSLRDSCIATRDNERVDNIKGAKESVLSVCP